MPPKASEKGAPCYGGEIFVPPRKVFHWQFFLLGDWFYKLVNKLTVSLLTIMLALELVWKLTLKKNLSIFTFHLENNI